MVVSVEPPVFLGDERVGARIIDNVLVTPDGTELLSRFSRDLVVCVTRGRGTHTHSPFPTPCLGCSTHRLFRWRCV
jgi:hypothetical protein